MKNKDYNGSKNSIIGLVPVIMISMIAYLTFSCASSEIADSKDVNQAKIYQSYTVDYDADSPDSYTVTAQFRFGGNKGTTLRLSDPSKVIVNDTDMEEKSDSFSGCYYQTNIKSGNEFVFKFIDTEKKEYVNSVKIQAVKAKEMEIIIADQKTSVYWEGTALAAHESMSVSICDNEGNCASASTDVVGTDYIVISPSDMEILVSGKGNLYLTRNYSYSLTNAADEGGNIYTTYKSETMPVKIINKFSQDTANK